MNARLNRTPRRHVDLPTGYELITVPPHGKPQITCPLWPDCGCQANCTAGSERAGRMQWAAIALMLATAAIAGLIYVGTH